MGYCQTFWKGESQKCLRAMSSGMIKNAMWRETLLSLVKVCRFCSRGQTAKHLNSLLSNICRQELYPTSSLFMSITSKSKYIYLMSVGFKRTLPFYWHKATHGKWQTSCEQLRGLFSIHQQWCEIDVQSNTSFSKLKWPTAECGPLCAARSDTDRSG